MNTNIKNKISELHQKREVMEKAVSKDWERAFAYLENEMDNHSPIAKNFWEKLSISAKKKITPELLRRIKICKKYDVTDLHSIFLEIITEVKERNIVVDANNDSALAL